MADTKTPPDVEHCDDKDPAAVFCENVLPASAADVNEPTAHELKTLRRVPHPISWLSFTIAVVELVERFTYYGTGQILTNFIQHPLPKGSRTGASGIHGQSGALGRGQRSAFAINTFKSFFFYATPLLGAYLADTHWGRFRTICISSVLGILSHVVIVVAAIPSVIARPSASLATLIVSLVGLGISTGGVKANLAPFIAEQLDSPKFAVQTLPNGEKVLQDPDATISRVYLLWYGFTNVGAFVGSLAMPYVEKYAGFWVSWLIPTILYLLCPLIMLWGRRRYKRVPSNRNVIEKASRLLLLLAQKSWSSNPVKAWKAFKNPVTWAAVKPSSYRPEELPTWMTFDDAFVDEIRRGLKACQVFAWYPIFFLCFNQINSNLISQAATMQLHGLPNEFMSAVEPLAIIVLVPIFDRIIYPSLRKRKIRFTPIRRITTGYFLIGIAMLWSTVLQYYIYKLSPCGKYAGKCKTHAPIHVVAQVGVYVFAAMGQVVGTVTILDYAYAKAPVSMRSIVQALSLMANAVAAALGEAFAPLSEDPLLVWNYLVLTVLAFVGGGLFWLQTCSLDAEDEQLNALAAGNVTTSKGE